MNGLMEEIIAAGDELEKARKKAAAHFGRKNAASTKRSKLSTSSAGNKKMRTHWRLSDEEFKEYRRLPDEPGYGFGFWGRVAYVRGLDLGSLLSESRHQFSGLPLNHGKHWCHPQALRCKMKPEEVEKH